MKIETSYTISREEEQLLESFARNNARLSHDDIKELFMTGVTDYDTINDAMICLNRKIVEMANTNTIYVPVDYNYSELLGSNYIGSAICKTFDEAKEHGTTIIMKLLYGLPLSIYSWNDDDSFVELKIKGSIKILLNLNTKEDK